MRFTPEILGSGAAASAPMYVRPVRVLVSEPDAVSRGLICSLLKCEPEMTVTCVDDSKLVPSIHESAPDLVIVDVHTPAIRRASNWEAVGVDPAPVTIVTGYNPSTVSAFASNAIDFLVKPFDAERLEDALRLANSGIASARNELQRREWSTGRDQERFGRHFLQRMAVETGEKIMLLKVGDIRWMQSSGNQVRLHLAKTSYLIRQSMSHLQVLLDPVRFLRIHRNAIVNLDHVEEFHLPSNGNMFVKLNDGLCLPLRKSSRALLRKLLKEHFLA